MKLVKKKTDKLQYIFNRHFQKVLFRIKIKLLKEYFTVSRNKPVTLQIEMFTES